MDQQADLTKLRCAAHYTRQLQRAAGCDAEAQTIHSCLSTGKRALNHLGSNHVSLSKETASAEKSVRFQQAGNVCTHS